MAVISTESYPSSERLFYSSLFANPTSKTMNTNFQPQESTSIKTVCGRELGSTFKAIKLARDERHNFHIVYRTFSDEFIYSFCNPFLDTSSEHVYRIISEEEAKAIFMPLLSQENARELFSTAQAPAMQVHY
jgi:hypothetical protein